MQVNTTFFIPLLLCFCAHACNARRFPMTTSISQKKFHHRKIDQKLESSMNFSPNKFTTSKNEVSLNPTEITEDFCQKTKGTELCKSAYHKALLPYSTKSEGSRLPHHLNVREMDLHSSFFRGEDLSVTDYQAPHRKSPIHNK